MKTYKYIVLALIAATMASCSVGTRMHRGSYNTKLNHIPRPERIEVAKDTTPIPQYNKYEIVRPDSTRFYLIPAFYDEKGKKQMILSIPEVTVVGKSRSLAERGGKVNLDFIVTIPKELMGNIQSLMVTPYLHKNDEILALEDLTVRGELFSRVQDRNYWQFEKYKSTRTDSTDAQKAFSRFVNYPYPEGVRLDSIVEGRHSFAYHYTQDVKADEAGNKMLVTMKGKVVALDHSRYELPLSDTLEYNISSMLTFVDTTKRYMTKIIEKYAYVQDRNYLNFKVNETAIIDSLADNAKQLERIESLMNEIINQKEFHIDSIILTASASPEGSIKHNDALAKGRAFSLRDRLVSRFKGDVSKILSVKWIGEDWAELERLVSESEKIRNKAPILDLITRDADKDAMEREIRAKYPQDYQYMLDNLYPLLRAVSFKYDLRRVGMVKDTIHTTVVNEEYMHGVELLKDRKYSKALEILEPYKDRNTAIAMLSLGYDQKAYELICLMPESATAVYLKAIAAARLGKKDEALACFKRACELDDVLKWRANLDPEIYELTRPKSSLLMPSSD